MATTNITGPQKKTFERLICSPVWEVDFKQHSISFSAVNILLSITATLGNSLILVALHKESSLHPPSKLLYRCLATSDLLVGLVNHPLFATYWMSLAHEHWILCRYARNAGYISNFTLCGVSLFTMAAISVDRLLVMLLGLRYKEVRWFILSSKLSYNLLVHLYKYIILPGNLNRLVHKDFPRPQSSSGSDTRSRSTTADATQSTEHGAIQKGSVQCTVGAVSISCLLCTKHDSGNCDIFEFKGIIEFHGNQGNGKCLSVL